MIHSDKELELIANHIREDIIKMLVEAGSGHTAGPLGMADIFTALYFEVLRHQPHNPEWPERDRVVLSNGHINPVLYATMARAGYFEIDELKTLRKFGTRLQGHPERLRLPGLETTSGPLGSGISQASGMALALRMNQEKQQRVWCLTSDGEHQEGNTWEAIMFAGKNKLSNLTVIVDRNNIQIDGMTEDVMPLEPFAMKYQSFNWHVIEINGHDFDDIVSAMNQSKAIFEKPTCIIAHTIPGKGVDFMEFDFRWHGIPPGSKDISGDPPKDRQAKVALEKLRTMNGKIRSEHE
ncbi:transketolase [Candidatus Saccharibacteria bacterium]|jgi:transketolase|nr:transketolase [Candidatus Saccharibacteria bacterium]